jgi:hypothetical protein
MSTDQERSFIARVTCEGINMTFFERVLSEGYFQQNDEDGPHKHIITTAEALRFQMSNRSYGPSDARGHGYAA